VGHRAFLEASDSTIPMHGLNPPPSSARVSEAADGYVVLKEAVLSDDPQPPVVPSLVNHSVSERCKNGELPAIASAYEQEMVATIERWRDGNWRSSEQRNDDVGVINWLLENGLLDDAPTSNGGDQPLVAQLAKYRELEIHLPKPNRAPAIVDGTGEDEFVFLRGNWRTPGERAASEEETARIKALLGEAMDAGAFGFSSTLLNQHMGFGGRPLACRNASREELKAYCNALRDRGKGAIECAMTRQISVLEQAELDLLDLMLEESGRPVTLIALFDRDDIPEALRTTMRKLQPMIARGARPQTSPLPLTRELVMRSPFAFAAFPSWKRLFVDTSKEAQRAVYKDAGFRSDFRKDLKSPASFADWARITVHEMKSNKHLEGKTVAEIARERGVDGVDALLDLTLEDDLENEFTVQSWNTRVDRMAELFSDKSVLLGLGDGGAHLDMLCDSGYPTYVLGTWVRERKVLTLEEGVRRMTSDPADFYGIRDRGRIAPGMAADLVIVDPRTVGMGVRAERLHDLPGGGKRMVKRSRGVEYTLVNGEVLWERGNLTGAAAGKVLRS
jgi:N-acyl-D-aspartate/D-glutamate deacylase